MVLVVGGLYVNLNMFLFDGFIS